MRPRLRVILTLADNFLVYVRFTEAAESGNLPRCGVDPFNTEQWALVLPRGASSSPTLFASPTPMIWLTHGSRTTCSPKAANSQATTVPRQVSYKSTTAMYVPLSFINNYNTTPRHVSDHRYRRLRHGSSCLPQYGKRALLRTPSHRSFQNRNKFPIISIRWTRVL